CRVLRLSGIRFFWGSTRSSRRSIACRKPRATATRPTTSSGCPAPSTSRNGSASPWLSRASPATNSRSRWRRANSSSGGARRRTSLGSSCTAESRRASSSGPFSWPKEWRSWGPIWRAGFCPSILPGPNRNGSSARSPSRPPTRP
ncbi:MAG: Small heat shock protein, partial [uncultured Microvirga sp.]